jgi:hypothetical protein
MGIAVSASNKIREIQKSYIQVLRDHFSREFEELNLATTALDEFVQARLARHPGLEALPESSKGDTSSLKRRLVDLFKDLQQFWQANREPLRQAIRDSGALVLEAREYGTVDVDLISKFALYYDSIALLDPLGSTAEAISFWADRATPLQILGGLRAVLHHIAMEPLAISGGEFPILILHPSNDARSPNERQKQIFDSALNLSLTCLQGLLDFGEPLRSREDIARLSARIAPERILQAIQQNPILRGSQITPSSLVEFCQEGYEYWFGETPASTRVSEVAKMLTGLDLLLYKNFYEIAELDIEARLVGSFPLLHESFQWALYNRYLFHSTQETAFRLGLTQDEAIVLSFQSPRLQWLSNITVTELVALREKGFMQEMRDLFRLHSGLLRNATLDDYRAVGAGLERQLSEAMQAHSERLRKDQADLKRKLGLSALSLLVGAAFGICSAALPALQPLAVVAVGYSAIVGAKSVRDIVNEALSEKRHSQALASRPVGVLLNISKRPHARSAENKGV